MRLAIVSALVVVGCAETADAPHDLTAVDQAATVCGSGPTVKGIDVSSYQGTIDWAKVKADGVQYAIIRVSDGLNSPDSKFAANWAGAKTAGVIRGAYQYFEPGQDAIAQADMLLAKIGTPQPGDLPPTIDVEATGGQTPTVVAAKVKQWIQHVKAAVGKDPIVYTGFYFWRDSVGGADVRPSVLFHAQYTTATCPNIAAPWTDWAFWQYTSTGAVNGISGNVDTDRWNGTLAQLQTFIGGGTTVAPCGTIDAAGGEVDDGDACFEQGGPTDFMRHVSTAGESGDLIWTHATDSATEANYGQWNLNLAAAGRYTVEVYTAASFAQSTQAKYLVHANGADAEKLIDQTASDGWQTLGDFDFAAGDQQFIHLGDNTGETPASNTQLVFDAVRLTPASSGSGSGSGGSDGSNYAGSGSDPGTQPSGCNAGGSGSGLGLVLGLGVVALRRRRR